MHIAPRVSWGPVYHKDMHLARRLSWGHHNMMSITMTCISLAGPPVGLLITKICILLAGSSGALQHDVYHEDTHLAGRVSCGPVFHEETHRAHRVLLKAPQHAMKTPAVSIERTAV